MTAQTNAPRPSRPTVEFAPNVPVTVALAYSEPRRVPSQRGGERCMYSTTDGRALFLDPEVAAKIADLGVNVREPISITMQQPKRGAPATWTVERAPEWGDQPDGTFAAPKLPDPPPPANPQGAGATAAPKPPQRAEAPVRAGLVDEANALVDAYAAVLERALTTYQGRIKPDEVRSILLSAYIQRRQLAA